MKQHHILGLVVLLLLETFILINPPALFAQKDFKWGLVMSKGSNLGLQIWRYREYFPQEEIKEGWNDNYYITALSYGKVPTGEEVWVVVMSKNAGYSDQIWRTRSYFPQEEIEEGWQQGYYITSLTHGKSKGENVWALVMSKDPYISEQRWYTRSYFPKEEIKKAWEDGFSVASVNYGDGLWALVVDKDSRYGLQRWYTRDYYPKDEIKEGWDLGYDINHLAYGDGLWAVVMSKNLNYQDQLWKTRKYFPKDEIKEGWDAGHAITGLYMGYEKEAEAPASPPSITWQEPAASSVSSYESIYNIKACVSSETKVQKTTVYLNGVPQNNRGFEVVPSDGCTMVVNETLALKQGSNEVKIVVSNEGGSTTSQIRYINYMPKVTQTANPTNEPRTALIIGNSDYLSSPLKNPSNDARAIAHELRQIGFEVFEYTDASHEDMEIAIQKFGQKIQKGGVGLFYYAGHGLQVGGTNYLVPVDAQIESETEVKFRTVALGLVLAKMEDAKNRLNIVVLDACRNNPFKRSWRSAEEGLATALSPTGTFIAYATAPGSVAADGEGDNGLYTEELLKAMRTPGLRIEDVFKRVRKNVRQRSNNRQVPWESSSIEGDFYFRR